MSNVGFQAILKFHVTVSCHGVSACRHVGVAARVTGRVALLRRPALHVWKPPFAEAPQPFILRLLLLLVRVLWTCNAGRAGAQPYRVTRADAPTRLSSPTNCRLV